jgi:hypothetical protein
MNQQLRDFARSTLKAGLAQLPAMNLRVFALMYGRKNGKRSVDDAAAMSINDVVDEIPEDKLDWAMQQVERTLQSERTTVSKSAP